MARGKGIPRTDIERAMNHYGITEEEYCENPDAYPLPERGTGLVAGTGIGIGTALVIALVLFLVLKRR